MKKRAWRGVLLCLLLALVSACGGVAPAEDADDGETAAGEGGRRDVPTMPAAQFAQPTSMINPTAIAASGGDGDETGTVDLERGERIYTNRCSECHGPDGGGVAGEAEPLTDFEMDLSAFTTLLRTGGGGELGPSHIFGSSAISPSGMEALYAYMVDLLSD